MEFLKDFSPALASQEAAGVEMTRRRTGDG
jgi:hypothetical protein